MLSKAVALSLHQVLNALSSLKMPIAVMGGVAVATWNHFRTTKDLDLLVGIVDNDVAVVACEDLIVLKLLAGRVIDRTDAAALTRINRDNINLDHLLEWVRRLDLRGDFEEIWREAFPGESVPR